MIRRLLELVVVLNMLAVLIGCSVSASRGLFAMARDGWLPPGLTAVDRRGTPTGAAAVVIMVNLGVTVVTVGWPGLFAQSSLPHYVAVFSWRSVFGGVGLALIYLLVSVGALRGLRDHRPRWAVSVASLLGVGVAGVAIFGAVYKVVAPLSYAPPAALAVFVVGVGVAFARNGRPVVVEDRAGPVSSSVPASQTSCRERRWLPRPARATAARDRRVRGGRRPELPALRRYRLTGSGPGHAAPPRRRDRFADNPCGRARVLGA